MLGIPKLADDFTGTAAVIVHALQQLPFFDFACCIYATAPLLQARYLRQGIELLEQRPDKSFTFSVCGFGFPVQRALTLDAQGALTALYPEFRNTRSQDLSEAFQDAGQFYWGRTDAWLGNKPVFGDNSKMLVLPDHLVQDIDTAADWQRAELLHQLLLQSTNPLKVR